MRLVYKLIVLLAAPSALWSSFELYGLTLAGPQMLFFAISHAFPIFAALLLSAVCFIVWALFTVAIVLSGSLRKAVGVPLPTSAVLSLFSVAQVAALMSYEQWSHSSLRLAVCVVGIAFVITAATLVGRWLLGAQQGAAAVAAPPRG